MPDNTPTVHLRTSNQELHRHLDRMCALAGWRLETYPPGGEVPGRGVVLDDADAPANQERPIARAVAVATQPRAGVLAIPGEAATVLESINDSHAPAAGRVIAVAGVRGGLGTTALAAALAQAIHRAGHRTVLVDLDPVGGGVELLLGLAHDPGPRWADLADDHGAFIPQRLRLALPTWQGVAVLSADARGGVDCDEPITELVITALARACDVVVLDLPRHGLAPLVLTKLGVRPEDLVLLVGSDLRSAVAAEAVTVALRAQHRVPHLVGRVTRTPALAVGDVAAALGLPLLATLRNERGFDTALAHGVCPVGVGRGSLTTTARRIAAALHLAQ